MFNTIPSPRQAIIISLLLAAFFLPSPQPASSDEGGSAGIKTGFNIIDGEWQRTDGGYMIRVTDTQEDGHAIVSYFNPKPIHVAQAAISTEKSFIKLFIKFQDKGYEGSTYKLYYYAEKDALVGFYYQAVLDKTYEVIFLRKTS